MREFDGITPFVADTPLLVTAEIISPLLLKQQCIVSRAQVRLLQRNILRKDLPPALLFIFDKLCATLNKTLKKVFCPMLLLPKPELNA